MYHGTILDTVTQYPTQLATPTMYVIGQLVNIYTASLVNGYSALVIFKLQKSTTELCITNLHKCS